MTNYACVQNFPRGSARVFRHCIGNIVFAFHYADMSEFPVFMGQPDPCRIQYMALLLSNVEHELIFSGSSQQVTLRS